MGRGRFALSGRISLVIAASYAFVVTVLVSVLLTGVRGLLYREKAEGVRLVAGNMSAVLHGALDPEDRVRLRAMVRDLATAPEIVRVTVVDRDLRVLADAASEGGASPELDPLVLARLRAALRGREGLSHALGPRRPFPVAYFAVPLRRRAEGSARLAPDGAVHFTVDLSEPWRATRDALLLVGAFLVAGLALLGATAWASLRWFVIRPLRRLEETASRLARGDLSARTAWGGRDEIGRLGRTLDRMAEAVGREKESLERTEERYRLAALATNDVLYEWEIGTDRLTWSGKIVELLGVPSGKAPPTMAAWRERIHPEDREVVDACLRAHLKGASRYRCPYRVKREDGSYVHIQDQGRAIRAIDGTPARFVGAFADVTERVLSERRLQALWDVARMVDADARTICDHVIRELMDLTESPYAFHGFLNEDETVQVVDAWSREAMEDCRIPERPIEYPLAGAGAWAEAVRRREPLIVNDYDSPFPGKRGLPEGHVPLTRFMAVPVIQGDRVVAMGCVANKPGPYTKDDARQVETFLASIHLVLEKKRVDEELRRRRDSLRSLCELAVTWRGPLLELCDRITESLSELLGVSHVTVERLEGDWIEIISMRTREGHAHEGRFPLHGSPCREVRERKAMCEFRGPLDALFPEDAFFQAFPLRSYLGVPVRDRSGAVIGILHVMHDRERDFPSDEIRLMQIFANTIAQEIERSRIEEELNQAQRIEAVGRLAGGIAHDFNNTLTAVMGFADLALRTGGEEGPVRRHVQEIKGACARAAGLTGQLLTFSRRQPSAFEALDLNARLQDTSGVLARLIGEDIALRLELAEGLRLIEADPVGIDQVVMNLAVNARDAMPGGGSLVIRTENVDLDAGACRGHPDARPGAHVRLSVEDTGIGMDEATLGRIFEPFFTTKGEGRGTGLGLSVVHGIVRRQGGWISVESAPGAGTRFRIHLPEGSAKADEAGPAAGRDEMPRGGTERILLVEDEEIVRDFARLALQQEGYRVSAAASFREAVALFDGDEDSFDLVLTDVTLPDRNGFELVDTLRRKDPRLRAILTSGYVQEGGDGGTPDLPHVPFLPKPYEFRGLLAAVRRTLDAAAPPSPGERGAA